MFLESNGQCTNTPYTRIITRETNEEGRWNRLLLDITEIAKNYGCELDHCLEIFENVSCSKKHLKLALEKATYT
jgi:hypothetical protein